MNRLKIWTITIADLRIITKRSFSSLMLGFLVTACSATSVLSQPKNRVVQWPETIITPVITPGSDLSQELANIEALEIIDVTAGGNQSRSASPLPQTMNG